MKAEYIVGIGEILWDMLGAGSEEPRQTSHITYRNSASIRWQSALSDAMREGKR